jgi:hypothetical protein
MADAALLGRYSKEWIRSLLEEICNYLFLFSNLAKLLRYSENPIISA